ncbi:MAG: CBASS oligonucleotide cyclase, partial [Patulibacter sp.]|nr:CBASS oligonucleotide cyclase [Patulibacter sp.]
VKTSVSQHLTFIQARKAANPADFAQVVRLAKWWAKQQKNLNDSFRFKSFMAELVLAHLADEGQSFVDYVDALEQFFAWIVDTELGERVAFEDFYSASELPSPTAAAIEIFDPVNAENNVASLYTEVQRRAIVDAAEQALDAIAEARYATTKSRAIECWQVVLGKSFKG